MEENQQPKIDKIVKEDKNPSEIDCPKEYSLSDEQIYLDDYQPSDRETTNIVGAFYTKDVKKYIKELKEEMDLCPVCKGGHGKWIGKDEMIELINEKFGEKLI